MKTIDYLFSEPPDLTMENALLEFSVNDEAIAVARDAITVGGIQHTLTYLQSNQINLTWKKKSWIAFSQDPVSQPLIAMLALHNNVTHLFNDSTEPLQVNDVRSSIHNAKATFDWFGDRSLLCADHLGLGTPLSLYSNGSSRKLKEREEFDEIIFPFIQGKIAVDIRQENAYKWRESLSSIMYELLENTELHARIKDDGTTVRPSIRGMIFRTTPHFRYHAQIASPSKNNGMLEILIFDCGQGYFEKITGRKISDAVSLNEEMQVLHNCLATHIGDVPINTTWGVHGIGLYEVLRALKFLNGAIEIRSGRLHLYRSFIQDDLQLKLQPKDSLDKPGMPKAELLDVRNKYVSKPTRHGKIIGTGIRVVVPYGGNTNG